MADAFREDEHQAAIGERVVHGGKGTGVPGLVRGCRRSRHTLITRSPQRDDPERADDRSRDRMLEQGCLRRQAHHPGHHAADDEGVDERVGVVGSEDGSALGGDPLEPDHLDASVVPAQPDARRAT